VSTPAYLLPYERASRRPGVRSMLFPDQRAQEIRFDAIVRNCSLARRSVLDVGCGRADLLTYLRARGAWPREYTGVEAQPALAAEARQRRYAHCLIREGDFVTRPELLQVGAQVVVFSGSLNLLEGADFYRALRAGWAAAGEALVFNFPLLASAGGRRPGCAGIRWKPSRAFARSLCGSVTVDSAYEPGRLHARAHSLLIP
jgi:SAM-dependent methyltransferase